VKPDPTLTDTDGDGLIDSEERTRGLDPTLADTDGDGIDDQTEVNNATDGTDARDPADFNQITSGLVAYYRFNGDTSDFAGGDDNGTISGDNVTLAADRFGGAEQAYQFNGDGYIEVAHRADNNLLDNFTITAWVYADNLSAAGTNEINGIFSKEGSTMGAYLYFKDEKLEGQGTKGGEAADFLSKWSFVVLRVVGGQVYLYQNGGQGKMLAFGATATSPAANNIEPIRIGEGFEGRIDDLRYYNRALTEVEIKYIYEKTLAADDERLPESQ
jgi:hypothetical protein